MSTQVPRGFVQWRGESRFDGAPIALIVTLHTENPKTGPMIQSWIIRTDVNPILASQKGLDFSICGGCAAQGESDGEHAKGRWCYVNLIGGPRSVFEAYQSGAYPDLTPALARRYLTGRALRLGSYGDPVALPFEAWDLLLKHTTSHSGYTHSWRKPMAQAYRHLLMASVESPEGRAEAHTLGWRTFRVRAHDGALLSGEIVCPASPEGQFKRNCMTCLACDGADRIGKVDVVVIGHGGIGAQGNLQRFWASKS